MRNSEVQAMQWFREAGLHNEVRGMGRQELLQRYFWYTGEMLG